MDMENYKEQLRQVEAALAIDEKNEDLQKLRDDLLEVIALTEELTQINEVVDEVVSTPTTSTSNQNTVTAWNVGDRIQALRRMDGQYHTGTVDMIADDGISCTVKFDNSGTVDVVKVSSLRSTLVSGTAEEPDYRKEILQGISSSSVGGDDDGGSTAGDSSEKGKEKAKEKVLTREELEKRREIKKKKLLKKKQRMKEFEEQREKGKQNWQSFYKKGSLKGKHKVKGLNKKSIFASREDGKGKIGIGTLGKSGAGMTDFTPASAY